jgi:hypothetical protein
MHAACGMHNEWIPLTFEEKLDPTQMHSRISLEEMQGK